MSASPLTSALVTQPGWIAGDTILKPYGPKAYHFAFGDPRNDPRITILEGSVRSAKTWACIPKIVRLCNYQVQGWRVLTGVSKATIYQNVLNDLFSIIGPDNYTYNQQSGQLTMFDSKWIVIGAKDEGSEKYVRGLTVGVAVGDEGVLLPPSFVRMLLNRMSPDGARAYFTTNPDTPFHFMMVELIQNEELIKSGAIRVIHFTLDDNPNVGDEYKRHLNALYPPGSLYHKRFVLGLWVVAEGAIYKDSWRDSLMYSAKDMPVAYNTDAAKYSARYYGVDCGVDHPQVYLDVLDDLKGHLWFDREYWWDSNRTGHQKTDQQYREDLQAFMKSKTDGQVLLPPECASFEAELVSAGIWVGDADNEVLDGIKMTAGMMSLGRLHFRVEPQCRGRRECICGTQCCVNTVAQLATYCWDPKAKVRGEEKPIKMEDDGPDAARYVVKTKVAPWRLAS